MIGSVEEVARVALSLPDTVQDQHMGTPDFRVGGRIFCTARTGERLAMVKLPQEIQTAVMNQHPEAITPAAGAWGRRGSTLVRTDLVPAELLADLIVSAWRHTASKCSWPRTWPIRKDLSSPMADAVSTPNVTETPVAAQMPATDAVPPKGRQAAVLFVYFSALMDIFALGIMIPVLPNLIKHFVGGGLSDAAATAQAAHYSMYFAVTWGVMQFFCGPVMGMISDRFGRRPVLLISIFGLGIDYLFMALAPTLGWLFLGRVINGVTSASFSTANAYVADVTAPQDRAKAFGLMGSAFGVGFIVGPAIGGFLGDINLRLPFYFSAGLALLNWLYGFFVLPESLPKSRRSPALNWKRANPIAAFGLLFEYRTLIGLSLVMVLFQLAHNAFPSIFILFVGHRWHWGPRIAGSTMMLTGVLSLLVQMFVVGRVVKAVGERGALLIGLASAVAAFAVYGLAPNWMIFLMAAPVGALSGLIGPGAQSLMSRRVPGNQQGRLQGVNSAFMGVCSIFGPIIYLSALSFTVQRETTVPPGLPILIAAGFCAAALAAAWFLAKPVADAEPSPS